MDLNLIRVFLDIYETRSLTVTAERLHVTQSAVSQSLAKLRSGLDDPLFERKGGTMAPTMVADELYPTLRDSLLNIDIALGNTVAFVPQESTRQFKITVSELGEVGWLPNIIADVRQQAPDVRIQTVPLDVSQVDEWLQRGIVDLAIAPAGLTGHSIRSEIKTQSYVALMSNQHDLATTDLTLEAYQTSDRVVVSSDSAAVRLENAERAAGIETNPRLRAQHYSSMPSVLLQSPDFLGIAPRTIAGGWAQAWPFVVKELPFFMEPIWLCVYRRGGAEDSSGLGWLYRTVLKAVIGLPETFQGIHAAGND